MNTPSVMGILNITPDSFYDGGKHTSKETIIAQTQKMIDEGAHIIDIGAYSSRPGATHITEQEELQRLSGAIEIIKIHYPDITLSIDTFRSNIVEHIVQEFGNVIVNDISGGTLDQNMLTVCGKRDLTYICMHMQGTPQTMQQQTQYNNVIDDLLTFFETQISKAQYQGIKNIIIDPGFGFGKTVEQNFEILQNLEQFTQFNVPILVGISRKSMIQKTLHCSADEALHGTIVLNTIALQKGASILRVHDVKPAIEAITLTQKTFL